MSSPRLTLDGAALELARAADGSWQVDELATSTDGRRVRVVAKIVPVADEPYDVCRRVGLAREELAAALGTRAMTRVEIGTGGVGLGLVVQLEGGLRALLKPTQVSPHSSPRHEVAAYRIAHALGLRNVPPTVLRNVSRDVLLERLPAGLDFLSRRILAETIFDASGATLSSVMAWAPDTTVAQVASLEAVRQRATWLSLTGAVPDGVRGLAADYARALLFDVVINNGDRWVGGNVLAAPDGLSTVWIDNGFAFGVEPIRARALGPFRKCQRFSRSLVAAMRALDAASVRTALEAEHSLLDESELTALLERRDQALAHVDDLVRQHGAAAVLAFA